MNYGTNATKFYMYMAFVEAIIDPMMAMHNGTEAYFGHALTFNNLYNHSKIVSDMLQPLFVQVFSTAGSNTYEALMISGIPSYYQLSHEGARVHAAYTKNYGAIKDVVKMNDSDINAYVQNVMLGM